MHLSRKYCCDEFEQLSERKDYSGYMNDIFEGVVIGGSAEIGDGTFIGMGALIRDHVKVGRNCFIEMGAIVTEDMPDNCRAKTVPSEIKRNVKYIGW